MASDGHNNHVHGHEDHNHTYGSAVSHMPKKLKLSSPSSSSPFITDSEIESEFSHHYHAVARLNNGSFGCCPASIVSAQQQWHLRYLRQPDDFFFNHLQKGILQSRTIIKGLVNAEHLDEISIVDNASTAAAIVLQQVAWAFGEGKFQKGDVAIMLHYAYGTVKKSIEAYMVRSGGEVIEIHLPFPVSSDQEIISEFRRAMERGKADSKRVRLAVIDHVTSMPSVVIPVKELVKICRSPTSCDLHHPVVSHEYSRGLSIECSWIGTRDYSPQLVVPAVLRFVDRFEGGIEGIKKRNHDAVAEMGEMLAQAWGTHLGTPTHMCASMIMVGLPASVGITCDSDVIKLRTHLRDNFGIEVPIYYRTPRDGEAASVTVAGYARISHLVYNKVDDYYKLRDAIDQLVRDGFTCALLLSD